MTLQIIVLLVCITILFLINMFCGAEGENMVTVSFATVVLIILLTFGLYEAIAKRECEANLPRDRSCILIAVPEPIEEVKPE